MHHEWGALIVVYLFLGGLSAGLLAFSAVATLAGRGGRYAAIARTGALLAPVPVLVGTGLLVLDLGRPLFFWKLLVAFEPRSPMWLGTWLLTLFALVGIPYANLHLPRARRLWAPAATHAWRARLAIAALPIAIGVGVYTGMLLGVLVARPLWNTPLMAQLFLVSALSTGAAVLVGVLRHRAPANERRTLLRADATLIAIELVVITGMLLAARTGSASATDAVGLLGHGGLAVAFWGGVVLLGLLVPLGIEALELWHDGHVAPRWVAVAGTYAPALVVAGGFALRWVVVSAGQATGLV